MSNQLQLDPRAAKVGTIVKVVGGSVAIAAASGIVMMAGIGLLGAVAVGTVGLAAIAALPVAAEYIAMMKQRSLEKLAVTFSKEAIMLDEQQEEARLEEQKQQYQTSKANIQNAMETYKALLETSTETERADIEADLKEMQDVIDNMWNDIQFKAGKLAELKRLNQLDIAKYEASKAMLGAQAAKRSAAEVQRNQIARNAIKTDMRKAIISQQLAHMERLSQKKPGGST